MRQWKFLSTITLTGVILLCTLPAFSSGIGFYGTFNKSGTQWHYVKPGYEDTKEDHIAFGGGFIYDSNVSGRATYNYRLQIGLELCDYSIPGFFGTYKIKGFRIAVYNNFGFAIVNARAFRLWMGPQIGIFYYNGSSSSNYNGGGLTLGAVLGFNFNLGSVFTFSIQGGIRGVGTFMSESSSGSHAEYLVYGYEAFAEGAFIFRSGEL